MSGDDSYDPSKHPRASMLCHAVQKGFQAGSLLGAVVVAPAAAYYTKDYSPEFALRMMARSSCVGMGVSGAIGLVKVTTIDKDGLEDRAYRMHYNKGQHHVDRLSTAFAAVGAAAAAAYYGCSCPNIFGGASLGGAFGVLAHMVTRDQETAKKPNQMLEEAKTLVE